MVASRMYSIVISHPPFCRAAKAAGAESGRPTASARVAAALRGDVGDREAQRVDLLVQLFARARDVANREEVRHLAAQDPELLFGRGHGSRLLFGHRRPSPDA